jgi:nitrite reductase/ring-hydroxylating ferredoxin subunit
MEMIYKKHGKFAWSISCEKCPLVEKQVCAFGMLSKGNVFVIGDYCKHLNRDSLSQRNDKLTAKCDHKNILK